MSSMPNPVLHRKQIVLEEHLNNCEEKINSATRRQMVLMSQNADSLNNLDLINHCNELRTRKLFSFISLFVLPLGFYMKKLPNQAILLSFIPGIYFNSCIYKAKIFNKSTHFSYSVAESSYKNYLETVHGMNGQGIINLQNKWRRSNNLAIKDWLARNEYH